MNMNNMNMNQGQDGFSKLMNLQSVLVKQKFEMLEAMTGCETENKYQVFRP